MMQDHRNKIHFIAVDVREEMSDGHAESKKEERLASRGYECCLFARNFVA